MKIKEKYDWSDITLSQMQEINTLPERENKLDGMIDQLSVLLDMDPEDIKKMPVDDMIKEFNKWEFINEQPKGKPSLKLKLMGQTYVLVDFDKISLGQLVDIEEYVSEGVIDNAHKILSTLYLPKKNFWSKKLKEYEPNQELAEEFKELTMDKIYPTILFFYLIVQIYILGSNQYLEDHLKEMGEMMTKEDQEQLEGLRQKLKNELKESGIGWE